MSTGADLASQSTDLSKLGGLGGQAQPISSLRTTTYNYIQNYGNYDQRRGECKQFINPITNSSDGSLGNNAMNGFEGSNNALGKVKL